LSPEKSKENERKSKEYEENIVVVKEYEQRINKLSLQFRAASENGLFSQEKVSKLIADDILQCLLNARHELIDNHLACERNLIEAERYYHAAIHDASSW
jgi:ribosomal protein S25